MTVTIRIVIRKLANVIVERITISPKDLKSVYRAIAIQWGLSAANVITKRENVDVEME